MYRERLAGDGQNEGVQETVGATVWPALPWQRGYSSVLYLVSRTPNTPHRPFRTSSAASPPEDPRPVSRHRDEDVVRPRSGAVSSGTRVHRGVVTSPVARRCCSARRRFFRPDLRTRRRAAMLGGALGRQALELVGRVIDVAHRGGDGPVTGLVRDQAVHLLADTTVRGM